jgi:hypothetical protein
VLTESFPSKAEEYLRSTRSDDARALDFPPAFTIARRKHTYSLQTGNNANPPPGSIVIPDPACFGSILLNERKAHFSQAKLEIYGLFRALRALKIYLVGIRNLIIEIHASYI